MLIPFEVTDMHTAQRDYRRVHTPIGMRLSALIVIILLLAIPLSTKAQGSGPVIKLRAGIIVPGESLVSSAMAAELTISNYAPGEQGYYIVQFRGPVEEAWKDQVTATGAEILGYLPDFAFKVRMTPEVAEGVGQLTDVNWVGLFQPAYKLEPNLEIAEQQLYTVSIEDGADIGATMAEIEQIGVDIVRGDGQILTVMADEALVAPLARILDVAWIDANYVNETKAGTLNEFGAGLILGANIAHTNGFDGSTQIVAVADTGLGAGMAATAHPDIPPSQIDAIFDWPTPANVCYAKVNDGPIDVDSGHGTHVTTSVVGGGDSSGLGKGVAPSANLVFQAVEDYITIVDSSQSYVGLERFSGVTTRNGYAGKQLRLDREFTRER